MDRNVMGKPLNYKLKNVNLLILSFLNLLKINKNLSDAYLNAANEFGGIISVPCVMVRLLLLYILQPI